MHTLVIQKATKLILQSRFDNSTGEKMSPEQVLQSYCEGNNCDSASVEVVEIPFTKFEFVIGKHIYQDGQIAVSPDWREAPAVETTSIPVSDPGAAQ